MTDHDVAAAAIRKMAEDLPPEVKAKVLAALDTEAPAADETYTPPEAMLCESNFDDALWKFVKGVQKIVNDAFTKYENLTAPTIEIEMGKRYVKVVKVDPNGGRSVWGFVDKTNGDILKAASWKAPAKHARGNIFSENPFKGMSWTGPYYLK